MQQGNAHTGKSRRLGLVTLAIVKAMVEANARKLKNRNRGGGSGGSGNGGSDGSDGGDL